MKSEKKKLLITMLIRNLHRKFGQEEYLTDIIASMVESPDELHHVTHPVLWTGVKHVDIWVEK